MSFIDNIQYPYSDSWDKLNNHVTFTLKNDNVNYSLVNSLRRVMIANIDSLGFRSEPHKNNTIQIIRNDTSLNNQIICHRIAMIPVHFTNPKEIEWDDYEFILNVENESNNIKLVTTADFSIKKISTNTFLSRKEVNKILPPDPITKSYIPIVKLKPKYYTNVNHNSEILNNIEKNNNIKNSEKIIIHLTAKLVLSNGEENGHFSPVAISAYSNTIDEVKANEGEIEFIQAENEKALANNLSIIDEQKIKNRFKITQRERYFKVNEKGEPNSFDFKIESVGVFSPLVIFSKSINILISKISNLIDNLKTKNEENLEIKPSININNGYEITVFNENDTLGNLIQTYLTNMFSCYTLPPEERKIISISYYRTHPLEKKIVFTIKPMANDIDNCITEVIIPGLRNIINILSKLQNELKNKKEYLDELKNIK